MKQLKKMPEKIINFDENSEREKFLRQYLRNEIKCEICKTNNFKAEQNSPQQIMLTCINCGRVSFISPETFGKKPLVLKLWGKIVIQKIQTLIYVRKLKKLGKINKNKIINQIGLSKYTNLSCILNILY